MSKKNRMQFSAEKFKNLRTLRNTLQKRMNVRSTQHSTALMPPSMTFSAVQRSLSCKKLASWAQILPLASIQFLRLRLFLRFAVGSCRILAFRSKSPSVRKLLSGHGELGIIGQISRTVVL